MKDPYLSQPAAISIFSVKQYHQPKLQCFRSEARVYTKQTELHLASARTWLKATRVRLWQSNLETKILCSGL